MIKHYFVSLHKMAMEFTFITSTFLEYDYKITSYITNYTTQNILYYIIHLDRRITSIQVIYYQLYRHARYYQIKGSSDKLNVILLERKNY